MFLLLGNLCMENSNYQGAIKSFKLAQAQLCSFLSLSLFMVAMVNFLMYVLSYSIYSFQQILGWRFDNLNILVWQHLSENLYLAGHRMNAGKSLLELINTFGKEVYMYRAIVDWVSGEPTFCPSIYPMFWPLLSDFTQWNMWHYTKQDNMKAP